MGVALRRLGRLDESRTRLAAALHVAEALGSGRIAWRLAAELAQTDQVAGRGDAAQISWWLAADLVRHVGNGLGSAPELQRTFFAMPDVELVLAHAQPSTGGAR